MQDATPRQRIHAECEIRGLDAVVDGCLALLGGGEVDPPLLQALGGSSALSCDYWLRVWAMRGLLWAYSERAVPAVLAGLEDEAWRVREMSCKVVARHQLGEAVPRLAVLQDDPVQRVRTAADRALVWLTATGA